MIDLHCHLDLYPNPQAIRDECVKRGMYILSVTTTPSAWEGTAALAAGTERIKTALGLHPQLAEQRKSELKLFERWLSATRYVGEIGLDGAPEFKNSWETQVAVFESILAQCRAAGGRVLSIHSRRASGPVLECLKRYPTAGIPVLHWFSGTLSDLHHAIGLGCWFSVGPAMILKEKGQRLVSQIPRDRLITETDGPFAMVAGRPAVPWDADLALNALAQLWSISREAAGEQVLNNFRHLVSDYRNMQPREA